MAFGMPRSRAARTSIHPSFRSYVFLSRDPRSEASKCPHIPRSELRLARLGLCILLILLLDPFERFVNHVLDRFVKEVWLSFGSLSSATSEQRGGRGTDRRKTREETHALDLDTRQRWRWSSEEGAKRHAPEQERRADQRPSGRHCARVEVKIWQRVVRSSGRSVGSGRIRVFEVEYGFDVQEGRRRGKGMRNVSRLFKPQAAALSWKRAEAI